MNAEITKVAGQVVNGLQNSPVLLALLVMNAIGIGAGVWFLSQLITLSKSRWEQIMTICTQVAK
jgi:hypothetical protein